MPITRAEFLTAKKMVEEAITRHGDLRTALLTITNKLEIEAIHKSMKMIADYFVQTRKETQKQKEKEGR